MIFRKTGRKKPRPVTGLSRESGRSESEVPPLFGHRAEILFFVLAFIIIVAAITEPPTFTFKTIAYDDPAEEVRAEIPFQSEDLQATKQARDAMAAKTADIYKVDSERVLEALRLLDELTQKIASEQEQFAKNAESALKGANSTQGDYDVIWNVAVRHAQMLKERFKLDPSIDPNALALWVMPQVASVPIRVFAPAKPGTPATVVSLKVPEGKAFVPAYADTLAKLAREALEYTLAYGVAEPSTVTSEEKQTVVIMREHLAVGLKASDTLAVKDLPTQQIATGLLHDRISESARTLAAASALTEATSENVLDWARMQQAAFEVAKPFIRGTLYFDKVYTEGERERAWASVEPVMKSVERGLSIKRGGEKWTEQSRSDVKTYYEVVRKATTPVIPILAVVIAHAIFVLLALACLVRAAKLNSVRREEIVRNVNLALLLLVGILLVGRIVSYFDQTGFVTPVTTVAVLLAILVDTRYAMMVGFLVSCLVSIQFHYDWRLLVLGSAMTLGSTFGLVKVRRRSVMTNAALKATVVGMILIVAMTLAMDSLNSAPALRRILLVLLNGVACVTIVPGLLPPLERLFGITTDIQLLEYSDLNNEVLSKLAIEIPATYAHSLMLGQIAEAAADAIGANGLLARVCAYYHDIGKLRRPEYFSENQNGYNIHDDLSPRTSARAIAAHVTYGLEMAREYHLPKPIMAGITEHHGTSLISFFFQQAIEHHMRDDVREEDFRYPGPKPQSRETAILMICDAAESGVRSIKNPNEDRVREFVEKIVMGRSSDHQFDECGLTMKDLNRIKEVVAKRIASALHTRIAYPESKPESKMENVIAIPRGG